MKIEPGMIVMSYSDVGTHQIQGDQVLLVRILAWDPADTARRYPLWEVRVLEDLLRGDEALNQDTRYIDMEAAPEVMFAAPEDFDPSEWAFGGAP
jgi:hypothetical protein